MSKVTNQELKDLGWNRKDRRILLHISKQKFAFVDQARHNPIPSWRIAANKTAIKFWGNWYV